jgi:hypothetical protein
MFFKFIVEFNQLLLREAFPLTTMDERDDVQHQLTPKASFSAIVIVARKAIEAKKRVTNGKPENFH